MGNNFFTKWIDAVTQFRANSMNAPLEELDKAIGYLKNVMVHCDGDISYAKATGTLTWSDTIRILFIASNGNAIQNTIAAGNIVLSDNQFAYVDLNETDGTVLTVSAATVTTSAASNFMAANRLVLGYRNTSSDEFYSVWLAKKLEIDYGDGVALTGYSETEVGPVDASSGTANLDYTAGNVQRVTIGAGVDATLTIINFPSGSCSMTVRLEMAGAVPSSITIQSITVDTTGVTSGGEVIVKMLKIGSTWYLEEHHAS